MSTRCVIFGHPNSGDQLFILIRCVVPLNIHEQKFDDLSDSGIPKLFLRARNIWRAMKRLF